MVVEFFLYAIAAVFSTFAVTGLNLNSLFKHGHVWEARIFVTILIICMTHILEQFLYNLINLG
jgi:uncharacterized membrane protein YwzB